MSYLIQIQLAKTLCLAQFTFKAHCTLLFSPAVSELFPRHYNSLFLRKSWLITFIIILVTTIYQQKTSDYWFFGLFFKYVWRSSSSSIQNFWGVIKFFYRLRLGKVWISNETTLLSGILELSMMVNDMLFSNHHDFDFCVIFFVSINELSLSILEAYNGSLRSNKIPCSQNKAIYHFHMDHNAPCFPPTILRNHALFTIFPGYLSRPRRNRRHWLYKLVMKFSRHLNLAMLMWRRKMCREHNVTRKFSDSDCVDNKGIWVYCRLKRVLVT